MERKKNRVFFTDNISALLSSAGLHLSVFSSLHKIESQEIAKTKALMMPTKSSRPFSPVITFITSSFWPFYALQDLCEKNSNANMHFKYSSDVSPKRDTKTNLK
jgi:hypothetical protein